MEHSLVRESHLWKGEVVNYSICAYMSRDAKVALSCYIHAGLYEYIMVSMGEAYFTTRKQIGGMFRIIGTMGHEDYWIYFMSRHYLLCL